MLLMIHGISQQEYCEKQDELRLKWVTLLEGGLKKRGASDKELRKFVAPSVMLFYADITDPDRVPEAATARAAGIKNYEDLIRQGLEADVRGLQNWGIAHLVAKWGDDFPIIRDRIIKSFAREAFGYFEREEAAEEVDQRCDDVVSGRTFRAVLTHSFGTVVGYRLLSRKSNVAKHFVTMGSPLGTPFMMAGLKTHLTRTFDGVETWHDYADPDDIVSYREIQVERMFQDYIPPPVFEADRSVVNETRNEHSIEGYITQPQVVDKILEICRGEE